MRKLEYDKKIQKLVMTALMICLVLLLTSTFKIPVPMTQGYVHLGDAMIFLSVMLLGKRDGALAAGIGSALGDILGGYAFWAPWTFVIKFLMAFIMGLFIEKAGARHDVENGNYKVTWIDLAGMVIGGLEMAGGYLIAERFLYGNWAAPVAALPWNIGQFIVGAAVAIIVAGALCRTPVRKLFRANAANAGNARNRG